MLDVIDDQILSRRRHSLCWFAGGACSLELVAKIINLHLLLGVNVNKLPEKIFARCGSHRQVVHVSIQMIHEVRGGRSLSRPYGICCGISCAEGIATAVGSALPTFLNIVGLYKFDIP